MSIVQPAPGGQTFNQPILPPTNEPAEYNTNYVLYWNNVALDLNRLTVSLLLGPYNDPPSAARALAIVHLAINDAYFSINPDKSGRASTYLSTNGTNPATSLPTAPTNGDARLAVTAAAVTVLRQLYTTPQATIPNATTIVLRQYIDTSLQAFPNVDALSASYQFGIQVGQAILNELDQGLGPFNQGAYQPPGGEYGFDDDPTNPIRIVPVDVNDPSGPQKAVKVYASPFYGFQGKRIAVQGLDHGNPTEHILADPPVGFGVDNITEYDFAFEEVYRQGGAQALNTTSRRPDQSATAFFWAYDGANLIGTPPRHYNQILRRLAVEKAKVQDLTDEANNAEFARLFALVNAAMGDAGIYAWLEKYTYQFWRPLSGVRQDSPNPLADPFWLTQGAPDTNTNVPPFKPPFPSYPSGHATFGGAGFQAMRLFYKQRDNLTFADDAPDNISFTTISDELNGISRDLRNAYDPTQPITNQLGTVRTDITKTFPSLWAAMFDNAISRVYLGVHWGFDAFAQSDVLASPNIQADGTVAYKAAENIMYQTTGPRTDRPGQLLPIGGVPLGIGIANDIFEGNVKPAAAKLQPGTANLATVTPNPNPRLPLPTPLFSDGGVHGVTPSASNGAAKTAAKTASNGHSDGHSQKTFVMHNGHKAE